MKHMLDHIKKTSTKFLPLHNKKQIDYNGWFSGKLTLYIIIMIIYYSL